MSCLFPYSQQASVFPSPSGHKNLWRSFVMIRPWCVQDQPPVPSLMIWLTVLYLSMWFPPPLASGRRSTVGAHISCHVRNPGVRGCVLALYMAVSDPGEGETVVEYIMSFLFSPAKHKLLLWCDRSNHCQARQNIQPLPEPSMQQLLLLSAMDLKSLTPSWNIHCSSAHN